MGKSEAINVRIPAELKAMMSAIARVEGRTLSEWSQNSLGDAVSGYLAGLDPRSMKSLDIERAYREERQALIAAGKIQLGQKPRYRSEQPIEISEHQLVEDLSLMKSDPEKLTRMLNFKASEEHEEAIKAAAKLERRSVSSFMRDTILTRVQEMLSKEAG